MNENNLEIVIDELNMSKEFMSMANHHNLITLGDFIAKGISKSMNLQGMNFRLLHELNLILEKYELIECFE